MKSASFRVTLTYFTFCRRCSPGSCHLTSLVNGRVFVRWLDCKSESKQQNNRVSRMMSLWASALVWITRCVSGGLHTTYIYDCHRLSWTRISEWAVCQLARLEWDPTWRITGAEFFSSMHVQLQGVWEAHSWKKGVVFFWLVEAWRAVYYLFDDQEDYLCVTYTDIIAYYVYICDHSFVLLILCRSQAGEWHRPGDDSS